MAARVLPPLPRVPNKPRTVDLSDLDYEEEVPTARRVKAKPSSTILPPARDKAADRVDFASMMASPKHIFNPNAGALSSLAPPPKAHDMETLAPVSMHRREEVLELTAEDQIDAPTVGKSSGRRGAVLFFAAALAAVAILAVGASAWMNRPVSATARPMADAVRQATFAAAGQQVSAPLVGLDALPKAEEPAAATTVRTERRKNLWRPDGSKSGGESAKGAAAAVEPTAASENASAEPSKPAAESAEASVVATEEAVQEEVVQLPPFSAEQASSSLSAAANTAGACRDPGDPAGSARVSVTFAPTGRVTTAQVTGGAFGGTKTGGCIARAFRSARVSPFSGAFVTVHKTVTIN